MKRLSLSHLLILFATFLTVVSTCASSTSGSANAAIININAETNTKDNPVVDFFPAGSYYVTPIGVADGGDYNAWNAWGYVNMDLSRGWLHRYTMSSSQFSTRSIGDLFTYETDLLALGNGAGTSFTLAADADVRFFISDNPYWDNIGGVSLSVDPVPIPGALCLLGSGLIGLVAFRKGLRGIRR